MIRDLGRVETLFAEKRTDLLAEVIFQLRRVRARDRPAVPEVGAPRLDLLLEGLRCGFISFRVHGVNCAVG